MLTVLSYNLLLLT
jgi:transcriptional regulator with XRE-family HTH domain